jgi:hypothetical protein
MQRYPADLYIQFGPDDLPGGFILSHVPALNPAGWPDHRLGDWTLAAHPSLPVHPILDGADTAVGFALGFPVLPDRGLQLPGDPPLRLPDSKAAETWIYPFSGSWLVALLGDKEPRIYLDPAGSLAAIYSPVYQAVARSEMLIPYNERTNDRRDYIERMPIPHENVVYPPGMTPRFGIERLLPNHVLDLNSWQQTRYWPREEISLVNDTDAAVEEMSVLLHAPMAAVADRVPLELSLTAGHDSRTLLVCARDLMDRSMVFTTGLPGDVPERDVYFAKRMARRVNLPYRYIPYEEPSQHEKDLWLYRTALGTGNYLSYLGMRVGSRLDPNAGYMQSRFSGLARDIYTKSIMRDYPDWDRRTLTPRMLLKFNNAHPSEEAVTRMQSWMDNLPFDEVWRVFNLLEMEQTVGSRSALLAQAYIDTHYLEVWPYAQRRAVEIMNGFHGDYKREARYYYDMLRFNWPELAEFPINTSNRELIYRAKARRAWHKLTARR